MVAGILGTFSTGTLQSSDVVTMDWGFDEPALEQSDSTDYRCDLELNPIFAVSNHT